MKRIVPFFLTFAFGLLIASFFVTIAMPNFRIEKRGGWNRHQQYHQRLEAENQRLREENNLLQRQLLEKQNLKNMPGGIGSGDGIGDADLEVPPPPQVKIVRVR